MPILMSPAALADVYKFVNRGGQVFYTDSPNHAGYKRVIKTPRTEPKPVSISLGAGKMLGNGDGGASPIRILGNGGGMTPYGMMAPKRSFRADQNHMQYAGLIEQAAQRHGLDPALLHAVIRAESSYNPGAVSNKGAMGLMQLMPGTAARYGVRDPYDPAQNIFGGARYLRDLMGMFGSNVKLAVAAYNAGENNVIKYGNQVPPFNETRGYVSKVLGYYYQVRPGEG